MQKEFCIFKVIRKKDKNGAIAGLLLKVLKNKANILDKLSFILEEVTCIIVIIITVDWMVDFVFYLATQVASGITN